MKVRPFPALEVTVNSRIAEHLRQSLRERGAVVGSQPTWGDFVAAVEALGILPDSPLGAIEFGLHASGTGRIRADYESGEWLIREVTHGG